MIVGLVATSTAVVGPSPAVGQEPTCFGMTATIVAVAGVPTVGTDGDDVIVGTTAADDIRGGLGNDTICGLAGPDVIFGGSGDDQLDGDADSDRVLGGKGSDLLVGGAGADELLGNSGNDIIRGNGGADAIFGGRGEDTIFGGSGDDQAFGGPQDDTIFGRGHDDTLVGGKGDDTIEGGNGHDVLDGKAGNDWLRAGNGDDQLIGGPGEDILLGKDGQDRLFGGRGWDRCRGGKARDVARGCETLYLVAPERAAPSGVGDVTLPVDSRGVTALFENLPLELLGGQRTIDQSVLQVSYGFTEPVGCGNVGVQALDVGSSFGIPAELWVQGFAAGGDWDVEEFGRDGELFWVTWRSTCSIAPPGTRDESELQEDTLFMATWGAAGSPWSFSASAGEAADLEPLLEAFVAAASHLVAFHNPADADPSLDQVSESAGAGALVGVTASASDPDAGDTVTFSVDDGRFVIDPSSGVISRAAGGTLDFETEPSVALMVTATSSDGSSAIRAFTLNVIGDNEPPHLVAPIADAEALQDDFWELSVSSSFADDDTSQGDVLVYTATQVGGGLLPSWLSLDGAAGVFSGTPTAADLGDLEIIVTASDSFGPLSVSDSFVLRVVADVSPIRFAAFGDYGTDNSSELAVSILVNGFDPDLIVTTGDNAYGSAPIDDLVGKYYADYIGDYTGAFGAGSPINRFFPSLGNHEYHDDSAGLNDGIDIYLDYFTLPGVGTNTSGNERYYDFVQGPVHFFAVNSNSEEPDGRGGTSTQAQWLQTQLALSQSPWKIVYFHHSPYSSSSGHGSSSARQWDFEDWGATAVLSGHDHLYERIVRNDNSDAFDLPYFITGLGGRTGLHDFLDPPVEGSRVRYNAAHGALIVDATDSNLTFAFHSVVNGGTQIDSYVIERGTIGDDVLAGGIADEQIDGRAGDDQISGAGGEDRLIGGPGDDRFVFTPGSGNDTVADFLPGANSDDVVVLSAFASITTFAEVLARSSQVGADTVIDLANGDFVTLQGLDLQTLHADDFSLV